MALLLSWFALAEIPWYLVEWMMQRVRGEDYSLIEPTTELDNAFLIQPVGEGVYKLHPLIREFLRHQRQTVGRPAQHQQAFVDVLVRVARQVPQAPTRDLIAAFALVRPHLEVVAEAMTDCLSDEDLPWAFVGLARFFEGQGLYPLAEPWFQQCLSATQSRFGNEHPHVATSLNNLAGLYDSQGRYGQAEPLYVQALALRRQLLGENHPSVATSLNNLAFLYDSQGRYSEAEPLYVQALSIAEASLGVDRPNTTTLRQNLEILRQRMQSDRATPIHHRSPTLAQQIRSLLTHFLQRIRRLFQKSRSPR
ncbi:MAG: tetratricopeptide repeat protein [Leptolyngbyaceae cyanobacterium SM1_3_5]|nr:tetratricopeptide repeat protein [Leptolyngbyaceae cyanobacterium SM1_3_5]